MHFCITKSQKKKIIIKFNELENRSNFLHVGMDSSVVLPLLNFVDIFNLETFNSWNEEIRQHIFVTLGASQGAAFQQWEMNTFEFIKVYE